ncbi:MAG: polymer-forming cytoskeletal protein [Bacteroidales bacterium]|nr:polymer-forming cytoskeletal protein [Bacteroidales bacterium]
MSANYQRSDDNQGVNEVSRISAGSTVKGEITSPYNVRIDGNFEGKIISEAKVVVGEKAVIKGDIICNNADLWGNIEGDLYVKDTLSLKETCVMTGDLHIRRLSVELDAKFDGNCKMITEDEFNQLTKGEQPAMFDVPEQEAESVPEDSFTVGSSESASPFSISGNSDFPEA